MLQQAIIIALIILFIHATTWEGMIFEGIKKLVPSEGMFYKPLYGCPICMTPWWGSLIYWMFIGHSIVSWLLIVGAAAGLSVVSVVLIDLRETCLIYMKKNDTEK